MASAAADTAAPLDAGEPTSEDPAAVEEPPGSVTDPVETEP